MKPVRRRFDPAELAVNCNLQAALKANGIQVEIIGDKKLVVRYKGKVQEITVRKW